MVPREMLLVSTLCEKKKKFEFNVIDDRNVTYNKNYQTVPQYLGNCELPIGTRTLNLRH